MNENQRMLLHRIMMLQFALIETALYLDTHPTDQKALAQHQIFSEERKNLVMQYEKEYAPLTLYGKGSNYWNYLNSPWPWEAND